ncbi:MAG: cell division protein ZapA [candidate division Zixibacteria bacterium]|nr:cell division protein ZapA [candidate division Zixibacteria bacterium]
MDKSKLKVTIFGTDYALKADTSHEYIKETAAYVDKKMQEVVSKYKDQSDARVAVLAALNIADELFQVRKLVPENLERRTIELAETLQAALDD